MHTSRFLIAMKSIHIKSNIIDHSHGSETITKVLALCPQNGLVKKISIIRYQLHRMRSSNGVLDGLTSGFVNKSKARIAFFILHSCTVLLIFVPVLEIIGGIRRGKNDMAVSDSEGVVGIGLGEDPRSPPVGEIR